MKEELEKIIMRYILDIIYDKNTSINKKVDIIYKKLSKYNGDYIDIFKAPLQISKQEIEQMIITIITRKELDPIPQYCNIFVSNIAQKIIENKAKDLFLTK